MEGKGETERKTHHVHLVRLPRVDAVVLDVGYGYAIGERAHCGAAGPVAVDVLDEHVRRRVFDSYAFVLVCHFHIVDKNIAARDIDAVQATLIATSDDQIVNFSVRGIVEDQVEGGRVNKSEIVYSEIG